MKTTNGFFATRNVALALAALLFLAPAACGKKEESAATPKPAASGGATDAKGGPSKKDLPPVAVMTGKASRVTMPRKVPFVGTLAGAEQVTLSSESEGTIEAVKADLGDMVKKGQVLLVVSPEEFRLRKEQAQAEAAQVAAKLGITPEATSVDIEKTSGVRKALAEYENAKSDLERRRSLSAKNLIARKEVDDAEARFQVAHANVRAAHEDAQTQMATLRSRNATAAIAEKKWKDSQSRSPIDGAVEARLVSAGEYIKVGTPIFRLVDDRTVKLVGEVPENFSAALKAGLAVDLTVDGKPGTTFRGTLSRVSPSSNAANRAITVEARFPNPGRVLKPGFFGKGAVTVRSEPSVVVPKSAIVSFAGIDKVFAIENGVAKEKRVVLGTDAPGGVEIVSGLSGDEIVAISGTGKLFEGAKVTTSGGVPRPDAPAPADKNR